MTSTLPVTFGTDGLIPAVVQDVASEAVVMVAYMNEEALRLTRETGKTHFWSRSRKKLWRKGETSGNEQIVRDILVNCYADSLLIRVEQVGPGCHTDHATCYYRRLSDDDALRSVSARQVDLDLWYGAYEYLRDHDLSDVSTTSRLLRSGKPRLEDRLADELVELVGVLRGTHAHTDPHADVILEASQCMYWLGLISARQRIAAGAWLAPLTGPRTTVDQERTVETLLLGAEYWGEFAAEREPDDPLRLTAGTAISIADAVRAAGVDLDAVFAADLAELRTKSYLAPYFSIAPDVPARS